MLFLIAVNTLKRLSKFYVYILFLLITVFLVNSFFSGLSSKEFLYIGDQYYRFNYAETLVNSFTNRKFEDLNIHNSYQFIVQFWDALYYLFVYSLHIPFILAEKVLFSLVIYFSLLFSFIGFKSFGRVLNLKVTDLIPFIITLWYCFNPYTLVLWHGGVYNIGSGLTYSLAPLLFTYFYEMVNAKKDFKTLVKVAVMIFIMSFNFWMFATAVVGSLIFILVYSVINFKKLRVVIKNFLVLFVLCVPLLTFLGFNTIDETVNKSQDINFIHLPTFDSQQGGIVYQFLMRFSWGIYTKWEPRAMYSFSDWFFSSQYIAATVSIYLLLAVGLMIPLIANKIRKNNNSIKNAGITSSLLILLALGLFLAKGPQPPFGSVFMFLYNKVPFFSIFRSADYRFGFIVVLAISLLLIIAAANYKRFLFAGLLSVIFLIHSQLFINGIVLKGENIGASSYDRVVSVPDDYQQLIDYINSTNKPFGYVLPLPPVEYGLYNLPNNEHHIGQDLLSKFIKYPFFYVSASTGIATKTYDYVNDLIAKKNYGELRNFPINYLILRTDLKCDYCSTLESSLDKDFVKVLSNKTFSLFEVIDSTPLFSGADIKYKVISPVKYQVYLKGVKADAQLNFLTSYNANWKIYPLNISTFFCDSEIKTSESSAFCPGSYTQLDFKDIKYAFAKPIFDISHTLYANYANSWVIDANLFKESSLSGSVHENPDGSYDVAFTVYYLNQSYFTLTFAISFSFVALYIVYLAFPMVKATYRRMLK